MAIHAPRGFRGVFRTDEDARAVYAEAAGIGRCWPVAVSVPADADDAATLLRWANDSGTPITPRGSGSSMGGGAIGPGVIVDLSRMRGAGRADRSSRSLRAEAGVLRAEVDGIAAESGLRFPVDPSSGAFCTVGGMIATNAAGPHSLRFGPVRPWVRALDCVFADGSRATVRRGAPAPDVPAVQRFLADVGSLLVDAPQPAPPRPAPVKNSSGYALAEYAQSLDLVDLLVGSEGTLALFTAAELALAPRAPARASLFVSFRDLEAAVDAAVTARAAGAAACELLDRTFLEIAATAGRPLPVAAASEAALLVEVEGDSAAEAASAAERLRDALRSLGANEATVAIEPGEDAELWSFRHAASPALARLDPSLRSMQFIEDAAVPPRALAEYVRGVREALRRADTPGVIFGHAGDAHVHVNPLVDVRRGDWRARVDRMLDEVTELVARLGGTLSGEHGDGRLRTPLLERTWPADTRALFERVKRAFDPRGVLNPGVKVPLPGQRPLDTVKYDPSLDALPDAAARALQLVERERGYARFRLDLLH